MENEDIYTQWKEHRRHVPVPENFSNRVMANIDNRRSREAYELPAALTGVRSRLMQWSAAAGLILLGLMRIAFIALNLLRANSLMPY
jgi:hypothetical protein